jgi:heme-degrading monooxygenase HmoA
MVTSSSVFELRTYHVAPGKLDALQERFVNHALGLFEKHGLRVVGFWIELDEDKRPTETLVYLLVFDSRPAADEAWSAFRADPAWIEAKAKSEQDGPLTTAIESTFMVATDYSPLS